MRDEKARPGAGRTPGEETDRGLQNRGEGVSRLTGPAGCRSARGGLKDDSRL